MSIGKKKKRTISLQNYIEIPKFFEGKNRKENSTLKKKQKWGRKNP